MQPDSAGDIYHVPPPVNIIFAVVQCVCTRGCYLVYRVIVNELLLGIGKNLVDLV